MLENGQNAGGICPDWTYCDVWPAWCSPSAQGWQRKWNPFSSPMTALSPPPLPPRQESPGEGFLVKTSVSTFCF